MVIVRVIGSLGLDYSDELGIWTKKKAASCLGDGLLPGVYGSDMKNHRQRRVGVAAWASHPHRLYSDRTLNPEP